MNPNAWKLLLLPLAALAELLALCVAWAVAPVRPHLAARLVDWASARFPDRAWYMKPKAKGE